jgi:presqualene diphosphate synthase
MTSPALESTAPGRLSDSSGSTFFWPMLLLPPAKRSAMFAVYAFCRAVDDIVDEEGDPDDKRARLAAWRDQLRTLFLGGAPRDPVARALAAAIQSYHLPRAELEAVIDGVAMDLVPMRAPPLDVLRLYCRRVAGAVGLLAIRIFDRADERTEAFALALGEALQLTNILRDLDADAGLGRLYLPREYLVRAGILDTDPMAVLVHPGLPAACETLAAHAVRRYEEAEGFLAGGPARRLWSARAMMILYRRLLDRLRERGWSALDVAPSLGTAERAGVTLRCLAGYPPRR